MLEEEQDGVDGAKEFFLMALAHDSLQNYMTMNFVLMKDHGYSLRELEEMVPWERETYMALVKQRIEEEKLAATTGA